MTLLCGALSWLADHKISDKNVSFQKDNDLNEPEWLKNIRKNNTGEQNINSLTNFNRSKRSKIVSPSNINEQILNLVKLIDDSEGEEKESYVDIRSRNYDLNIFRPKIIYCSRTHSQLAQVVNELKKTSFFQNSSNSELNLAIATASRNTLCINKDLKKDINSSLTLNEACNELIQSEDGCPFFNRQKDEAFKEHLNIISAKRIIDIEDILSSGISSQCCPYYLDRYLVQPAAFIATPYNSILDKATREAYGIELENSIIIFDEAHNIVDFIKQMNSITIATPIDFFEQILSCIDEYLRKYSKRLRGPNVSSLSQLRIFFFKVSEFIKKKNYNCLSVNDFIYSSQIDTFNFSRLVSHMEETNLFTKVNYYKLKRFEFTIIHNIIGFK